MTIAILKQKYDAERMKYLEACHALEFSRADFEVKLDGQEKFVNMLNGSCQQLAQLISELEQSEKKELDKQKKK